MSVSPGQLANGPYTIRDDVKADSATYPGGHQLGLDGIRGLAVLLVMIVHFIGNVAAETPLQKLVVKAATYGWIGVDLFFVLSGFLITGILLESKNSSHYFANFYARRTLRIFPLYYFVLICLFLVLPRLITPSPLLEAARQHQIWLWTYTSNFYTAWTGSWASLNYVAHFWSLAIEEQFYLVWPVVVFSTASQTLRRICIATIISALLLRIALVTLGVSELSISVLTPCRVDALCVGAYLAIRTREPGVLTHWRHKSGYAALVLGIVLLGVMVGATLAGPAELALRQLRGSVIALLFGALILVALRPSSSLIARPFHSRTLVFFGKYSYGLYVYHGILTWYFIDINFDEYLRNVLSSPWLVMAARMLIGASVSTLVAVLSFHLIEQRFLALKRHFSTGKAVPSS